MKSLITSFVSAFLFAIGLERSGMTDPQKVVGFLDVVGDWNPALLFVMVGAIAVHFFTYRWIRRRPTPLFASEWRVPSQKDFTISLMLGSFLFGIGWGMAGYCPGPALVSITRFEPRVTLFVISMLVGMLVFHKLDERLKFQR